MQARWQDTPTDFFSDAPFDRRDERDDRRFYERPRLVHHLDRTARDMVADIYRRFVSDGMHSREDIPVALGELPEWVHQQVLEDKPTWVNPTVHRERTIWLSQAIGGEPQIAEAILAQVREAVDWNPTPTEPTRA